MANSSAQSPASGRWKTQTLKIYLTRLFCSNIFKSYDHLLAREVKRHECSDAIALLYWYWSKFKKLVSVRLLMHHAMNAKSNVLQISSRPW